jgi:hypothetical protein
MVLVVSERSGKREASKRGKAGLLLEAMMTVLLLRSYENWLKL